MTIWHIFSEVFCHMKRLQTLITVSNQICSLQMNKCITFKRKMQTKHKFFSWFLTLSTIRYPRRKCQNDFVSNVALLHFPVSKSRSCSPIRAQPKDLLHPPYPRPPRVLLSPDHQNALRLKTDKTHIIFLYLIKSDF